MSLGVLPAVLDSAWGAPVDVDVCPYSFDLLCVPYAWPSTNLLPGDGRRGACLRWTLTIRLIRGPALLIRFRRLADHTLTLPLRASSRSAAAASAAHGAVARSGACRATSRNVVLYMRVRLTPANLADDLGLVRPGQGRPCAPVRVVFDGALDDHLFADSDDADLTVARVVPL